MDDKRNMDALDLLGLFSTILGIANYGLNLTQNDFQEATKNQTDEIHRHLKEQDKKIDKILEILEEKL
jgi:hypothetical protein